MFKLFVVTFCFTAAFSMEAHMRADVRARIQKKIEACQTEVGASADDLRIILAAQIPETNEGKCIVFCVHKKLNIQKEDGSLDYSGALETLEVLRDMHEVTYSQMLTIFKKCSDTPPVPNSCDYGVALYQCVYKEAEAIGIHDVIL